MDGLAARVGSADSESPVLDRAWLDAAPVLISVSDVSGAGVWFNRVWLDFTGRTLAQEQGDGWTEGVHPDDLQRCRSVYREAFDRREPFRLDYRLRRSDGQHRWFDHTSAPYFGEDGTFLGYVGSCSDVTPRHEAELELDAARKRLQLAQEAGGVGVWDYDIPSAKLTWTDEQKRLFGVQPDEEPPDFAGFMERIHPDDRERMRGAAAASWRDGAYDIEFRGARRDAPDGGHRTFIARGRVVHDESGRPVRMVGVNVEVTARRGFERAMAASEARFRGVFDSTIAGLALIERGIGRSVAVNDRLLAITGHDREAFERDATAWMTLAGGRWSDADRIAFGQVGERGWFDPYERAFTRACGEDRVVRLSSAPLPDEPGLLVMAVEDVTEQRRVEERRGVLVDLGEILQARLDPEPLFHAVSELLGRRLRATYCGFYDIDAEAGLMHLHPGWTAPGVAGLPGPLPLREFDPVYEILSQGRPVAVGNARIDARIGEAYREGFDAVGLRAFITVPLRRRTVMVACLTLVCDKPRAWSPDEVELVRAVAERTWLAVENARLAAERDHNVAALTAAQSALARQIVERTRERNRVFDLSRELIAVVDPNGFARAVNPAWTELLGYTEAELLARPLARLIHPDDREDGARHMATLQAGQPVARYDNRVRDTSGGWLRMAWTAVSDGDSIYIVGRDVTAERAAADALREANARLEAEISERARMQEQLVQAQKMEAVGQLTGGVAHDFNNLLQVIVGALSLIDDAEPARRKRLIDAMRQAAGRGEGLTRQLLAFSRRSALKPEAIDLAVRVSEMGELLDRSLRGDVRVETRFAPDLSQIEADPGEFELALLNIAVNARDAMPAGGVITIAAEEVERFDDSELSGRFVRLSVGDTGEGMAPEVLARVFEPFFTTKEVGKGSGLGLSQVYGFARQSGGGVRIESEPGAGTTVRLYLPCATVQTRATPPAVVLHLAPVGGGGGRVLLVEDDDAVAELACAMLESLGFECIRAAGAAAALDRLRSERIDMVLSDIMMPGGVSGLDLARSARALRPDLPIVLATGFSSAAAEARAEGLTVLSKPYKLDTLRAALAPAAAVAEI